MPCLFTAQLSSLFLLRLFTKVGVRARFDNCFLKFIHSPKSMQCLQISDKKTFVPFYSIAKEPNVQGFFLQNLVNLSFAFLRPCLVLSYLPPSQLCYFVRFRLLLYSSTSSPYFGCCFHSMVPPPAGRQVMRQIEKPA